MARRKQKEPAPPPPSPNEPPDLKPAVVREWAKLKGLPVAIKGRVPLHYYVGYKDHRDGVANWRESMEVARKAMSTPKKRTPGVPKNRRPRPNTLKIDLASSTESDIRDYVAGKKIVWKSTMEADLHREARVVKEPNPKHFRLEEGVLHFVAEDGFRSVLISQIVQIRR